MPFGEPHHLSSTKHFHSDFQSHFMSMNTNNKDGHVVGISFENFPFSNNSF